VPVSPANRIMEAAERAAASTLNAFITLTPPPAAPPEGPLAGVPIGIKDMFATAGIRTTAGSLILRDWVPRRDAPVVRALAAAGAVSIGKTNTHEFALGTTNDNPHYGATRNPWNPALTTGGSSGGSAAAVAGGIVPLALGTDTAGSVRIPAALCGCVGFKPGWGVLDTRGVVPLARSLDTVGLLADSVGTARRAFEALANGRSPVADARIIAVHRFRHVDPEVQSAVDDAIDLLRRDGFEIRELEIPLLDRAAEIGLPIARTESLAFHRRWFPERRAEYGADVARALEGAQSITAQEYFEARRLRKKLERAMAAVLGEADVIAGPTVPMAAFRNADAYEKVAPGGDIPRNAVTRFTYPWNLARMPAITVPCGFTRAGLPVGLQLGAARGNEPALLKLAERFEETSQSKSKQVKASRSK